MYFLRLICKEWNLIVFSFLSLLGIFLCYAEFSVTYSIRWEDFIRAVILSIAGGFISGYVFYVFSVLRIKSQQHPPVLRLICQQIRYAKDELSEMSYNICGVHDINQCAFGELKQELHAYEITEANKKFMLQALRNVDALIRYPIAKVEVLDTDDIDRISKSAQLVIKMITMISDSSHDNLIYLEEKELNNIIEIHKMLERTYENLKEYE